MSVKTFALPSLLRVNSFMGSLLSSEKLSDVTLISEDMVPTRAHKLILSGISDYFKVAFMTNEAGQSQTSTFYMAGIKQSEIQSILELVYLGQTTIGMDKVDAFKVAAGIMKITGFYEEQDVVDGVEGIQNLTEEIEIDIENDEEMEDSEMETKENDVSIEILEEKILGNKTGLKSSLNDQILKEENIKFEEKDADLDKEPKDMKFSSGQVLRLLRLTCQYCGKVCKTNDSYEFHLANVHKKASAINVNRKVMMEPVDCVNCGETYFSKRVLKIHLLTHNMDLCTACMYQARSKFDLRQHSYSCKIAPASKKRKLS